ncbi:hypothetical protein KZZ52_45780 [Dactylosporangium sp. AC04546]|uniref:hypothetical protein n=1 Tax=Dactylosporangium sp. AC04546 TaxID=2862460 RepID=UPI001EDDAF4A|nr:hypothetical protein [Dactylosporangium sp. AC04546]WVK81227.1 hypothetical protein KZZ52_45780 [Dactylosporangium sp. AC04546]
MRIGLLTAATLAVAALTACSGGAPPDVPNLGATGQSSPPAAGGCLSAANGLSLMTGGEKQGSDDTTGYQPTCSGATGDARRNALHAAAECIRQHGIPTYKDPVLTADGHVYTDARSLHEADMNTIRAAAEACHDLIVTAELVPDGQAPAPPKLVQAGVKSAQCMRANGLPNFRDPTANDLFTPGHGFGMHPEDLPGDKDDPTVKHAMDTCRPVLDEEARASSLGSLGA